jgi:transcriptional regulator with XRE-family HTH domain
MIADVGDGDRNTARAFGERLHFHRLEARVTQEELADRCSMHHAQIGMLERGRHEPRLGTIIKIAGALGVEPGALIEGIPPR